MQKIQDRRSGAEDSSSATAQKAAQDTLDNIDFNKFWRQVINRVASKHDANEKVRALSWGKARGSTKVY